MCLATVRLVVFQTAWIIEAIVRATYATAAHNVAFVDGTCEPYKPTDDLLEWRGLLQLQIAVWREGLSDASVVGTNGVYENVPCSFVDAIIQ